MKDEYNEFSLQKLEEILNEVKDSKERKLNFTTGKLGAINMECTLRETLHQYGGKELTEQDKKDIRSKVESFDWKDGVYRMGDFGIEYLGKYE